MSEKSSQPDEKTHQTFQKKYQMFFYKLQTVFEKRLIALKDRFHAIPNQRAQKKPDEQTFYSSDFSLDTFDRLMPATLMLPGRVLRLHLHRASGRVFLLLPFPHSLQS